MARVRSALPNLINGISQQPGSLRRASQADLQVNGMSSVVEGLIKRPPTRSVAKILNTTANNTVDMKLYTINRDVDERYKVYFSNSNVRVFDLDGAEKTVSNAAGVLSYLNTTTPSEDIQAVTIADYTFVVNKAKLIDLVPYAARYTIEIPATLSVGCGITILTPVGNATHTVNTGNTAAATVAGALNTALQTLFSANTYVASLDSATLTVRGLNTNYNQPFELRVTTNTGEDSEIIVTQFAPVADKAMVFVKQGNYAINYTVSIYETNSTPIYTVTHTTSSTDVTLIKTDTIAAALNTALQALSSPANFNTKYICTASGSLLLISPVLSNTIAPNFSVTVKDSNGDRNLICVHGSVQKFADLPAKCFDGFRVKVTGDTASEQDDYYVQFNGKDEVTGGLVAVEGQWEEVAQYGIPSEFDASTMPHTLVRNADGTFTFAEAEWLDRSSGDVDSAPAPSFVGNSISDIFFFRNRLGFLADDKVILTEAGQFFSYWRKTVQAILDSDTIDVAASSTKVALLRHGVPFAEKLVLFSDQQQFVLSSGDILTPKTVAIKPSTSYESLLGVSPVISGGNIYFATPRGDFAGLRAYTVDKDAQKDTAEDVSSHVPNYIPSDLFKIAAASTEDLLAMVTREEPENLYIYKYFVTQDGKLLQASFSHWDMEDEIIDAEFIGSDLHLVMQREDGVYQEVISCEPNKKDTEMPSGQLLLDRRITEAECSVVYDAETDITTLVLPYQESGDVQLVVRANTNATNTAPAYRVLNELDYARSATNAANTLLISGDAASVSLWIGRKYTFTYQFSEQFVRQRDQTTGGESILTGVRLQLIRMKLLISETGYFRAEVTPRYGRTFVYPFSTFVPGQSILGSQEFVSGEFKFPIHSKSDRVTIQLINDSFLPCRFQSAEWVGTFTVKEQKV